MAIDDVNDKSEDDQMPPKKPAAKRGRPRLHADDMTETIQIRCTEADRDAWAELAGELGLAVGPWMRMLAMREVKKAAR